MKADLLNNIIFRKYKVNKVIGKGSNGTIFQGKNIINNELVAIKAESDIKRIKFLDTEAYYLFCLKGFGIPEVKSFGIYKKYKVLIETLLGEDLRNLFKKKKVNIKDSCLIFIQLLDRLEFIHSKYTVHRDLKPQNIMFDIEYKNIYLIDFGFAKKYRSSKTQKHIKCAYSNILVGSEMFCSTNATGRFEHSRKDDLESAGYVIIFLLNKFNLPWAKAIDTNSVKEIKEKTTEEELCKNLPKAFCDYMKYVKRLKFEEDPNYNYLRGLFIDLLTSLGMKNDLGFSWIPKHKKKQNKNPNYRINTFNNKKDGPQQRLLYKTETEEKKRIKTVSENKENKIINTLNETKNEPSGKQTTQFNKPLILNDLNERFHSVDKINHKDDINNFIPENNTQKLINNQTSRTEEYNLNQPSTKTSENYIINNINQIKTNEKKNELINDISKNDNIIFNSLNKQPINNEEVKKLISYKNKYNRINKINDNSFLRKGNELKNNSNIKIVIKKNNNLVKKKMQSENALTKSFTSKGILSNLKLIKNNINYKKKMISNKNDNYTEYNFNIEKNNRMFKNSSQNIRGLSKQIDYKNVFKMNFNTFNFGVFNQNNNSNIISNNSSSNVFNIINKINKIGNGENIINPAKRTIYQKKMYNGLAENKNFTKSKKSTTIISFNKNMKLIPLKYHGISWKYSLNNTNEV